MNRAFDEWFLDHIESNPLALAHLSRQAYMQRAGAEAIELIMWLVMRGALNERVERVHRFYQMGISLTGAGLIALANSR
jgi:protocatechuate 4,5-dioxygenase beta chain